jgi:hypothetical protein
MKISIMQPYFFPYLGYFSLIRATDKFISFDTAQYIRHGWVNRNRILHPKEGWQYIGVPLVQHRREATIEEVQIDHRQPWQNKLLGQLTHYKGRTRRYGEVLEVLRAGLSLETNSIAVLNLHLIATVCHWMEIPFRGVAWSATDLEIPPVDHPGGWAPAISLAMGAKAYYNPIGGRDLFRPEDFTQRQIEVGFLQMGDVRYSQGPRPFEPWLSIVDVMMFNTPSQTRDLLCRYSIQGFADLNSVVEEGSEISSG